MSHERCECHECTQARYRLAAPLESIQNALTVNPFGLAALPTNTVRVGKSAAGEMHLSAAGYCSQCNMLVELGTEDCPHAIEMWQKAQAGAKEPG